MYDLKGASKNNNELNPHVIITITWSNFLISWTTIAIKVKAVLAYVPSAVFPAIIFPGIFINDYGTFIEMNDPKIFGAIVAILVGYFSRNVIATILSGLFSYWIIIFIL